MRAVLLRKPVALSVVTLLAVMLLILPLSAELLAASSTSPMPQDTATACADAERQAKSDISGQTWFLIGCLGGFIGYIIGLQESNPPASVLLGKSPEYVAVYTDCYRKKSKEIKSMNALTGCLVQTGATVVLYVILIAAASSE